jgi:DNA helicase-2/ATP-dependent DNA helicase PcrA
MIDFHTLNPRQREAVEYVDGPTLVLAGAGSGKTRVLTYKIAHLVSCGIKPWRILAVTFTNKAAREMASRVEGLLRIPVQALWIGTFHSICVRILRREADNWGFRRDFTIYDEDDSISMIKKALKELGIQKEHLAPARAKNIISRAKNDFTGPDDLSGFSNGNDLKRVGDVYRRYMKLMQDAGGFDFDDLLVRPVEMFGKHPESLSNWKKRFDHILVDEYQDTNRTQYLLLRLLAGNSSTITVVGDDDQSIYSWRGANIQNILGFEKDFKGVKTVRLEQNYRSTKTILKAANAVVQNNKGRMRKELWTDLSAGDRVRVLECVDDMNEAESVVSSIIRENAECGYRLRDCVILYRTNAQSRAFEDVLRRHGIPYVIVSGIRFYERMEIKDILSYLRIIANPGDTVSFERAVTTPRRGIGPKAIEAVETYASGRNMTILEALGHAGEIFSGSILKKVQEFHSLLTSLGEMRGQINLDELAKAIVEKTGYQKYLETEEPESFEERMDNVLELITAMGEFENLTDEDDLSAFLAEVSLVSDVDTWDDNTDAVTLMTLHAAKGLEFQSVYITGVEEGLFPLPGALDKEADLEEERRLFYVGITRAKERLHVSYACHRMRYGSFTGGASMFIDELCPEAVDFEVSVRSHRQVPEKKKPGSRRLNYEDYSQKISDYDTFSFRVGIPIVHPVFGRGVITKTSGSGEKTVITVRFGAKEIKIMPRYVNLSPG